MHRYLLLLWFLCFDLTAVETPLKPLHIYDRHLLETSSDNPSSEMDFTRPHIPAHKTSNDGRIGLYMKSDSQTRFFLNTPEKILSYEHFSLSPAGMHITEEYHQSISSNLLHNSSLPGNDYSHATLCEEAPLAPLETVRNPYQCNDSPLEDCYDLHVIVSRQGNGRVELWRQKVRIYVSSPKTENAVMRNIDLIGSPEEVGDFVLREFQEATFTKDGRLLVFKTKESPLTWRPIGASQDIEDGGRNIVYSYSESPCGIGTGLGDLKPILYAPYDPRINTQYGFAMNPIRDFQNKSMDCELSSQTGLPINCEDFPGNYPWIDKEGRNLFFSSTFEDINHNGQPKYPVECVDSSYCAQHANAAGPLGTVAFFGLWSGGKSVVIDGPMNNIIYGIGGSLDHQRNMTLYEDEGGSPVKVRVGSVREVGATVDGSSENLNFLESIENRWNYHDAFKPRSPRDVVWLMNMGKVTTELVFDDFLNPNILINSNMHGALELKNVNLPNFTHKDRFNFPGEIAVANNATASSDFWEIPDEGRVFNGRIEPVALGGVYGKGLFLHGDTSLIYNIASQDRNVENHNWYFSLFIDPRFPDDDELRTLVTMPDGGNVSMKGRRGIVLQNVNTALREFSLSLQNQSWYHLGFVIENSSTSQKITIYLNGKKHGQYIHQSEKIFLPKPGQVLVGASDSAFKGWIDEFKLMVDIKNEEIYCNNARGTLVRLNSQTSAPQNGMGRTHARRNSGHSPGQFNPFGSDTVCLTDYTQEEGSSHLFGFNGETVREEKLFPEGPLYHNAPRPSSMQNQFCLSCHYDSAQGGLGLEALSPGVVDAKVDPRRQPMQPEPLMTGYFEAFVQNFDENYSQPSHMDSLLIDEILLPAQ